MKTTAKVYDAAIAVDTISLEGCGKPQPAGECGEEQWKCGNGVKYNGLLYL